ncbi:hypothetical protein QIS74_13697 [Colletotrichum tabaci]|uniref:Uncharacterized protein n=1 Tax=Colletotrichum tabaci TaxID=1209068 RepID=A0AAV9SV65_9PEZI
MLRHLALSLFVAFELAHGATNNQAPVHSPAHVAIGPKITKVPSSANCYEGDTVKFNNAKLTEALEKAWDCFKSGTCLSDTGKMYPSQWDNTGPRGSPKWTCGENTAAANPPVREFPIMTADGVFPPGDKEPGKYRVFYSVEKEHNFASATIHYCGVAQHHVNDEYIKCNGGTVAAATAAPTAVDEL